LNIFESLEELDAALPTLAWSGADGRIFSQCGEREAATKTLRSSGVPGYLVYGPYVALDAGTYEVVWKGACTETSHGAVAEVASNGGANVLCEIPIAESRDVLARIRFDLPESLEDAEFRLRIGEGDAVSLSGIELRLLKAASHEAGRSLRRSRVAGARSEEGAAAPAEDMIDYRDIVARYDFAKHAQRADQYFSKLDLQSPVARKPFASPAEAAELCAGLASLLPDLLLFPGARVLDFGAGTCWMARLLALLGCEVTAVDVSRKALEIGERLIRADALGDQLKVSFVPLTGPELPFADGTFDRVVCFDALHHVPDQRKAIAEFARVLVDGGIAALHEPGPTHSRSPQSQWEMRMHDVIEADVHVESLFEAARTAGFTRTELAVYGTRIIKSDLGAFNAFISEPGTSPIARQLVAQTAAGLENRRTCFLYKGDPLASMDSRSPLGLLASIDVSAELVDGHTRVHGTIANTGMTAWVPSFRGIGEVNIGVHTHGGDGRLIDANYARFPLSSDRVRPGEKRDVDFLIPHPQGETQFELVIDLVAERVSWFEIAGGTPARFKVSLEPNAAVRRG
jgi:SAM-dependent methyltransferase